MSYSSWTLSKTPIAYYRLGEASGTTFADSSGNGRDMTVTGTVTLGQTGLITGDADKSALFNGGWAFIAEDTSWMNITNFTARAVFKTTATSAGSMLARWDSSVVGQDAFSIGITGTGKPTVFIESSTSVFRQVSGTTSINDGNTHVLIATYDGTTLALYVDGSSVGSLSFTGSLQTFSGGLGLVISACESTSTRGANLFKGTLDEVALFNYAWSSTDVSTDYTNATTSAITGAASLTESTSVTVSGRKSAVAAAAPAEATSATIGGRVTARAAVAATESTEVDVTAGATLEAAAAPTEASSVTVGAVPSRVAAVSIAELTSLAVAAALDQMAAVAIVEDTSVAVSTASGLAVTITEATSLVVAGVVLSIGPVDDNLANGGALTMTGWSTSGYVVDPPSGGTRADIPAVHVEPA